MQPLGVDVGVGVGVGGVWGQDLVGPRPLMIKLRTWEYIDAM